MGSIITYLLILTCWISGQAQTVITGKLTDDEQNPISGVSVSYKKVGAATLLGFTKTDNQGNFELLIKLPDTDTIQLDFSHISYAKKSVHVVNATAKYTYILQQQVRQLEEVKIANTPIYRRKDTINYNVGAFTAMLDDAIADIIKKLPGIEMQGDQILYQGKPIQKYMVNNLDLTEGRYSMINKNLPVNAVRRVQIIENDQPIKIIDSLVFSDRASLNLELKTFTSTGTGKIGTGLSPTLWDLNLTPMTFGKNFQMINSLQTNNMGYDVSKDLRPFYSGGGYLTNRSNFNDGPSYISLKNVASPNFSEKKWLDNKIFLFSSNMLQRLKNGVELKANVSYYDDTQQRQGFTATQYYTAPDVITSTEAIDNRTRSNVLHAGVLIEKNEKNVYLRNYLRYQKKWNADRGNLLFNETNNILQRRNYTDEALFNTLSLAKFIGKQLVDIQSSLEYHSTPQRLTVQPGQFEDLINTGNPYDQMKQTVLFKGLRWDNSIGFIHKAKVWSFAPKISINYDANDMQSHIMIRNENEDTQLGTDYTNDMHNSSMNLALELRLGWENQKWKFNLNMPYNLFVFNATEQQAVSMDNMIRNTFNPQANLNYQMNQNNELALNISGNKQYGGLENFYNSFIISQYRTIQRYKTKLLGTENLRSAIDYNYRNTLRANFANASYSYAQATKNFIFATQIDALGRTTLDIKDQRSYSDIHTLAGGTSRFFANIKTVIKLNANTSWSKSDYLLNDLITKQHSRNNAGSVEIINNISPLISGDYKISLGQTNNKLASGKQTKIRYNNHYLNIVIHPLENHSLVINNALYGINIPGQSNQFFADATYRYTVRKWKTAIELTALNLLNNNNYIQQFSSNYELIQSYFELRPRQFMISTKFKF